MHRSRDVIALKKMLFCTTFGRVGLVVGMTLLLIVSIPGVRNAITYAHNAEDVTTLPDSLLPQLRSSRILGHHAALASTDDIMTVGLVLTPDNQDQMNALERALYNPRGAMYHHWLHTGDFNRLFGPNSAQLTRVYNFLRASGLHIIPSQGSLVVLASGTVSQVESAFHTQINDYRLPDGTTFFANGSAVQVPQTLTPLVRGVLGLSNLAVAKSLYALADHQSARGARPGYGAGPGGTGLTPAQIASIYHASPIYSGLHTTGKGAVLGLFELSGYSPADIQQYEQQFGLPAVPLEDHIVYAQPPHDQALEVELDIELQLALAPDVNKIVVYQAPNTDVAAMAELQQIANDNAVDSLSISWGDCETDLPRPYINEEAVVFQQMMMQGQSVFAASGDDGAFGCLESTGDSSLQVFDPASQPDVTAVGGSSFASSGAGTFDPGSTAQPAYPIGRENAWNKSGGGNSRIWSRPSYQQGPGVAQPSYSRKGQWCGQAATTWCREVPDVSLNADPRTGYAIYCTDAGDQLCASGSGWKRVGGTSAAAPLWAAFTALSVSYHGSRLGLLNSALYALDASGYGDALHDITAGSNSDGAVYSAGYPAGIAYDMVTGLGTPDLYHLLLRLQRTA